jgi:very-short-patch-repair endonuclease
MDRDARKSKLLSQMGLTALFFWETDINNNFQIVKDSILAQLDDKKMHDILEK